MRRPLGSRGFTYTLRMGQIVGVVAIVALSAVNYVGAGLGKTVQNIITVTKIGTMITFIVLGLLVGVSRQPHVVTLSSPQPISLEKILFGFGVALIAVSWTFDGWHNINYMGGEIRNPRRNLPLALLLGTLIITALYLLMNLVYTIALPIGEIQGTARIAEKASRSLFGGASAGFVSAAVLISTFGSLNGVIFVAPRVYFAMARDGFFYAARR